VWLCGALLLGCPAPAPITVGFEGGISGRGADLGISARDAVQLAVELRNQGGGVAGHKVRLVIKDDEQRAAVAERVARELVDEGAVAIVGPITSTMAKAVLPIAVQSGVVVISSSATSDELTGKDDPLFRVNMSAGDAATQIARFHLQEKRPLRRLVAAYDLSNRSYTESWLDAFRRTFVAGGGQVLQAVGFASSGDTAFLQVARDVLAIPADGIVISANSMDTAMLCQQIRKLGSELPIIASGWAGTERLLELGGRSVEGVMLAQNFDRDSTAPRYAAFRRAYLERFHREPGFSGTLAYDAANVLLDALARQQDPTKLKAAILAQRRFDGLQDPIVFDEFGDVQRTMYMTVVRNGKFVVIR
jgi:branched-chain amino acid transport system substrate-binding protein